MTHADPLSATIADLVRPGRGILAADESGPTITKRFTALGIESTETTRRDYRAMLFGTPEAEQYLAGVILFEETIGQRTADGTPLVEVLTRRGIVPGVNSGDVDLQFLRAMPLINRQMDHVGIERAFDAAETNNGWLIFYGHDVTEKPSPWGCSPGLLNLALEVAARRKIPVLTMAEALQCARA